MPQKNGRIVNTPFPVYKLLTTKYPSFLYLTRMGHLTLIVLVYSHDSGTRRRQIWRCELVGLVEGCNVNDELMVPI